MMRAVRMCGSKSDTAMFRRNVIISAAVSFVLICLGALLIWPRDYGPLPHYSRSLSFDVSDDGRQKFIAALANFGRANDFKVDVRIKPPDGKFFLLYLIRNDTVVMASPMFEDPRVDVSVIGYDKDPVTRARVDALIESLRQGIEGIPGVTPHVKPST